MKFDTQTQFAIAGTFVLTDKDGNVVKVTPFTGILKEEARPRDFEDTQPNEEADGNLRE